MTFIAKIVIALVIRSIRTALWLAVPLAAIFEFLYGYRGGQFGFLLGLAMAIATVVVSMGWEFGMAVRASKRSALAMAAAYRRETRNGWEDAYKATRAEQRALESFDFGTKSLTVKSMQHHIDNVEFQIKLINNNQNACRW